MSKIEVDAITQQSGTTVTVGGGACKTAVVDATTVTLGRCGGTVALASGASQTGFGRTGTVDWQTGSIKTSTFTAVSGQGFFADTSSGAFTMNLPAGTAGAIVSVVDYTNTFQTNSLTITPNGTQKLGGVAASAVLSTEGQSVTFVYVDDTEGWKNVQDSTSNVTGNPNFEATGGSVSTLCTNFKVHTFTSPGTFCVSNLSSTAERNIVSYLVVAGGGSGGSRDRAGGGGAGGYREGKNAPVCSYTASPLNAPAGITIPATGAYPITVGAGAAANPVTNKGNAGSVSTFSSITSAGGGAGGNTTSEPPSCLNGGSGGGMGVGGVGNPGTPGGLGNQPPVSPPQGSNGGSAQHISNGGSGGGGGATAAGGNGSGSPPGTGGSGGAGATSSINGTPTARAGGGGGGGDSGNRPGGTGGGGAGQAAGTANTGGGGGGTHNPGGQGGAGGSGIVIIRYRFQ